MSATICATWVVCHPLFKKVGASFRGENFLREDYMQNTDGDVIHGEDDCEFQWIPVDEIEVNRFQFRKDPGDLSALVESVRGKGVWIPIKVARTDNGRYRIIYGERRWMAAKVAGLSQVPCLVVAAGDEGQDETSLIENAYHESLNIVDQVFALSEFVQRGYSNREISTMVGRSESHISKAVAGARYLSEAMAAGFLTYDQIIRLDTSVEKLYEAAIEYRRSGDMGLATDMLDPVLNGGTQNDGKQQAGDGKGRPKGKNGERPPGSSPRPITADRTPDTWRWQLTIGRPIARRQVARALAIADILTGILEEINDNIIALDSAEIVSYAGVMKDLSDRLASASARIEVGMESGADGTGAD